MRRGRNEVGDGSRAELVRKVRERVTRAEDALADCDYYYAGEILGQLLAELAEAGDHEGRS